MNCMQNAVCAVSRNLTTTHMSLSTKYVATRQFAHHTVPTRSFRNVLSLGYFW